MNERSEETKDKNARESIGRRRLLAAVAVAGTGSLAGCPDVNINVGDESGDDGGGTDDSDDGNDGSDGGGGGNGSDGGNGVSGDLSCTDVTNGYDRQDVGARPVVFDFEYPALFDELEYLQAAQLATYEASRSDGDVSIDIAVSQITTPEGSVGEDPGQGAGGTTTTFNGEEVNFVGFSSGSELSWFGDLPYQIDGQRETLGVTLVLSYAGDGSNECGDALREAAEHIAESMEVNPETTIDS